MERVEPDSLVHMCPSDASPWMTGAVTTTLLKSLRNPHAILADKRARLSYSVPEVGRLTCRQAIRKCWPGA
jgi:hypothetical protein